MNLEETRKLASEALEVAEEEIAFAHDTKQHRVIVPVLGTYKRQRRLSQAVLELADEVERLRIVESEAAKMLAEYELRNARVISSIRIEKMREALANPREEET